MNFFNTIANLNGTLSAKTKVSSYRHKDVRSTFIASLKKNIADLMADKECSRKTCYFVKPNGEFKVYLKFGVCMLPLVNGTNEFTTTSKEIAKAYMEAAIDAASAGEFDDMLNAIKSKTARKPKIA